jgi:uncharacterized protein (DUF488 family)
MKTMGQKTLFTIGHSNHSWEQFVDLLKMHEITTICDVRSVPRSRMNPQFDREVLKGGLREAGLMYVFLGTELGGRSEDPACCDKGKVLYERVAGTPLFRKGLQRVEDGIEKRHRMALMCAEREPLECHRSILIGRQLDALGITVQHIHADGRLEDQKSALHRLLRQLNLLDTDMFRSRDDVIADAYRLQGNRIAYDWSSSEHLEGTATRRAAG